jgi:hypothetical protein
MGGTMKKIYYIPDKKNKYHAEKVKVDGEVHASKKEYQRFCELNLLERIGKINNLRRQVKFELVPSQWEEVETDDYYLRGPKKGQPKKKRVCVEQAVSYIADFVYEENGNEIVEDTKGMRLADYIIKRKLMLYVHGIKVVEK